MTTENLESADWLLTERKKLESFSARFDAKSHPDKLFIGLIDAAIKQINIRLAKLGVTDEKSD